MIGEKLSRISKEKAEVETLLRDANKDFPNDDNVKKLFEQYKGFFKETVLLEEAKAQKAPKNVKPKPATMKTKEAAAKPKPAKNVKELAEKPKELAEKAQEAPQNVKPKPATMKTKEAAAKPKPAKNVKELAEKPKELVEKAHEAPQNVKPKLAAVKTKEAAKKPNPAKNVKEVAEKPKEPTEKAQEAPQYVKPKPAAVKIKEAAEKPMPAENVKELAKKPKEPAAETFTQWIEGNIDWVGEDELHDWPRVVKPVNMVQPSTPKRVFSSPSKGYVKPVKTVNTPYMCRRIDVTARCKRTEFLTAFQYLGGYRELSSIICEMIEEKLSRISKEKAKVETLLRDANKDFPNDDNVKKLFEQYKGFFKETVLLEEAKAQKAPQNVKPKPATVKTKEAAENAAKKPKPTKNVKEVAEKPNKPAQKAQEVPQYVKPKPAAVKTKEAAEKPMPIENDELHDWPLVVEPVNMVQPSTPKRVFSLPSKGYVKPVKTVHTPYMCRRIDVTARCKRIEFVLGNSLFAMEGDKYETVFQSLGGYRELSSVRVNMETLAPTLCIDANVIDCWVAHLNFEELALGYPTPTRHFFLYWMYYCGVFAMIHMENYVGDAAKNWEFGLCEESDEQLSMLQRMRSVIESYMIYEIFQAKPWISTEEGDWSMRSPEEVDWSKRSPEEGYWWWRLPEEDWNQFDHFQVYFGKTKEMVCTLRPPSELLSMTLPDSINP
nr:hypothetical protein [Tanacetum cinerariifolium]